MRKLLLSIVLVLFASPLLANQNYCLSHIQDHLFGDPSGYELDLTNCQLQDTDMAGLNDVFKAYPGIAILTLDKNNISEKGIETLTGLEKIIDISIDDNPIGDNGLKVLLNKATKLDQLSINRDKITNQSVPVLAQSNIDLLHLSGNQISNASSLANKGALDISFNPLSHESLLKLTQSTSLYTLYIAGSHLDGALLKALRDNQNITDLDISQSQVGDSGVEILSSNSSLLMLHLNQDQISDVGVKLGISKMNGLKYLLLSGNNITAIGIKALPTNTLDTLDLSGNHLGDADVGALKLGKIGSLYLDNNNIQAKGAGYLASLPLSLRILSINNNKLGSNGAKILMQHTFNGLYIDNNSIGDEGALSVVQMVSSAISMANNNIDDKGVLAFEPLLNTKLFYLDVRNNQITSVGKQALENHQPKIDDLYVDDKYISKNKFFHHHNLVKKDRCSLTR